jgi:hypothetical protein
MSVPEYMLYHQNMLAQVKSEPRPRPVPDLLAADKSGGWCQNHISANSRKYPSMPTIPRPVWQDAALEMWLEPNR